MPEIVAENIEQLVSVEMRMKGLPRGTTSQLVAAARREVGRPLILNAAERLLGAVSSGSRVLITCATGGPPYLPNGETDGPIGGAALANTLSLALNATPMFIVSDPHRPPVIAASMAVALPALEAELALDRSGAAGVIPFPVDRAAAPDAAAIILDSYQPDAIISIETLGPNARGVVHSITGFDLADGIPAYYELVTQAQDRDILTAGIGDGGNEIGFGRIFDDVRDIQEYGGTCQCPCEDGMATVVAADVLVAAAVSNWGAYGLAAMIAFLTGSPDALHSPEDERRMIDACTAAGGVDGAFSRTSFTVDGIDGEVSVSIIRMLHEIIRRASMEISRPF